MSKMHVSPEQRRKMIEEAAYYRALERGFEGGDPIEDWLNAELEIDSKYCLRPHDSAETGKFYRHLAEEVCSRELMKTLGNTVPLAGPLGEPPEASP
jgi:Protein of unknown function (DUF2934)